MEVKKLAALMCAVIFALSWRLSDEATGDVVKFKHGARKQCIVLEETEKSVRLLTSMGEIEMPLTRIESIERESDETNEALRKEWAEKKTKTPKEPEVKPAPVEEKPHVRRTYNIDITKRRVSLGGKTEAGNAQPIVSFIIQDFGAVEGSRLFHISLTSYKSTSADISVKNFHALLGNGSRVDAASLEGYDMLDARVRLNETVTGHLAFPADADINTVVLKSDLADFDLDLETGEFVAPRSGLF
ncbi:MAG: hypothetical protein HY801_02315 [Candidatus Lindowbacteria bacterium]|nr:hypothetical protein [Candidatus Lindowbacteria bacterium]